MVQVEHTELGRYLPVIRRYSPNARTVLDELEISYAAKERLDMNGEPEQLASVRRETKRIKRFEIGIWQDFDAVVAMSNIDQPIVEQHVDKRKTWTVPNGVDLTRFAFHPRATNSAPRLIFVGYFLHHPNVVAVMHFCQSVWPNIRKAHPDARFDVIGGSPPDEIQALDGREGVRVLGFVPDVRPYMEASSVMVVPILSGGGTRLKVLEAFASGVPVMSTLLGCAGIDVAGGSHVVLAETDDEMSMAVHRLLENPRGAQEMAAGARRLVEEEYSWEIIGKRLEAVWRNDYEGLG